MKKYKYYFRKPKSKIVIDILNLLLVAGTISIAATSPYFLLNFWKSYQYFRKYSRKKFYSAFYRLRRAGCLEIRRKNHQFFIALTEKGRYKAGRFQIDSLTIKRPKKWDKKWRLVIFDISQLKKIFRELLRSKLKELGFYPLQKSVWIHAFDCRAEIELLKEFFGLKEKEVRLIIAEDIGEDSWLKKIFKIS